jgi:hypothetical protein
MTKKKASPDIRVSISKLKEGAGEKELESQVNNTRSVKVTLHILSYDPACLLFITK